MQKHRLRGEQGDHGGRAPPTQLTVRARTPLGGVAARLALWVSCGVRVLVHALLFPSPPPYCCPYPCPYCTLTPCYCFEPQRPRASSHILLTPTPRSRRAARHAARRGGRDHRFARAGMEWTPPPHPLSPY